MATGQGEEDLIPSASAVMPSGPIVKTKSAPADSRGSLRVDAKEGRRKCMKRTRER